MTTRAEYDIVKVCARTMTVWLVDIGRGRSVTNDAEHVASEVNSQYPGYRIIYRDTNGDWDEIKHERGEFLRFLPARGMGVAV